MTRKAICSSCDVQCSVHTETPESGLVGDVRVKAHDPRRFYADLCIKGVNSPRGFAHPKRILTPLRRTGARGSGQWEEVAWDTALDEIAARLLHNRRRAWA